MSKNGTAVVIVRGCRFCACKAVEPSMNKQNKETESVFKKVMRIMIGQSVCIKRGVNIA